MEHKINISQVFFFWLCERKKMVEIFLKETEKLSAKFWRYVNIWGKCVVPFVLPLYRNGE